MRWLLKYVLADKVKLHLSKCLQEPVHVTTRSGNVLRWKLNNRFCKYSLFHSCSLIMDLIYHLFFFVGYIFCFSTFSCLHFYSPAKVRRSGLLCACLLSGVKNLPCFPADRKTQHALSAASCSGLSGQWGSFAYRHRAGQWLKNTHNVFTVQPGCQSQRWG